MSRSHRMAMIEREAPALSVRRQCALLGLARSGVYRVAPAPDPQDLALMRRLDELYLELPFYGSRKMTLALKAEGHAVNRKRVQRLMRTMGSRRWCRGRGRAGRRRGTRSTRTC